MTAMDRRARGEIVAMLGALVVTLVWVGGLWCLVTGAI